MTREPWKVEIFRIAAMGIITAMCVMLIREHRPDIALIVGIAGGVMTLLSIADFLSETVGFLTDLISGTGADGSVTRALFRVVGIGLIADYAAGIVEESGSKALAEKIVLGGKLLIFVTAIPIIKLLFGIVGALVS